MGLIVIAIALLAILAVIGFAMIAAAAVAALVMFALAYAITFGVLYALIGEQNMGLAIVLAVPLALLAMVGVGKLSDESSKPTTGK